LVVCWSISIKLWWFGGVFQLNFGGLKYSNIAPKFNGNTPTYTKKVNENTPTCQQSLIEILHQTTKV
jgi:hypothetical protein